MMLINDTSCDVTNIWREQSLCEDILYSHIICALVHVHAKLEKYILTKTESSYT